MTLKSSGQTLLWVLFAAIILVLAISMLNRERVTFGVHAGDPSERYIEAMELMQAGQWKAANTMMTAVALSVSGRADAGWFDQASVAHFPCADLYYMDAVYSAHSEGRFGLRAQHEVMQSVVAALPEAHHDEQFLVFAETVGWRKNGEWLGYADLFQGDMADAPKGHLPIAAPRDAFRPSFKSRKGTPDQLRNRDALMLRLAQCSPAAQIGEDS